MKNILLGVTGSVAAIKTPELVSALQEIGDVKVVATKAGSYFLKNKKINAEVLLDDAEWPENYNLGDPILHIELRKWASCLVVAPLDANTMAKFSYGLCDNLLTSVFRAWDWSRPVIVSPAMNTMMWENPPTRDLVANLMFYGCHVIPPVAKRLACNDVGMGAMASVEEIVKWVNCNLRWQFPLKKCNGIPINHHPGAFGFHRRKNHHTGCDLYCAEGEPVYAVESGIVVKVDHFTGPKAGHDWWEETHGIMVEGSSGVVNYGEVSPQVAEGDHVVRGQQIAAVKRVLFADRFRSDIPGHSTSMLHFELYKHGTREFADWHDPQKNPNLLDPTPSLMASEDSPKITLTWENEQGKPVG